MSAVKFGPSARSNPAEFKIYWYPFALPTFEIEAFTFSSIGLSKSASFCCNSF